MLSFRRKLVTCRVESMYTILRIIDGRKEWAEASITYLLILQILQVINEFPTE